MSNYQAKMYVMWALHESTCHVTSPVMAVNIEQAWLIYCTMTATDM